LSHTINYKQSSSGNSENFLNSRVRGKISPWFPFWDFYHQFFRGAEGINSLNFYFSPHFDIFSNKFSQWMRPIIVSINNGQLCPYFILLYLYIWLLIFYTFILWDSGILKIWTSAQTKFGRLVSLLWKIPFRFRSIQFHL
jgi:hypothetical protein